VRNLAGVALAVALAIPAVSDLFQGQPVNTTVNARGSAMPNTVVSKTKDGKVCKSILITGSRLGATPVCKSKQEWDDLAYRNRNTIERGQSTTFKAVVGGRMPQ
jgi:hypothetical protein